MTEMRFHAVPLSVIVKPTKEPIFSELATIVAIENEAAGHFISLRQNEAHVEKNTVHITSEEWPLVRDTIETMLVLCAELDSHIDT